LSDGWALDLTQASGGSPTFASMLSLIEAGDPVDDHIVQKP
jgi:hypothetical protein